MGKITLVGFIGKELKADKKLSTNTITNHYRTLELIKAFDTTTLLRNVDYTFADGFDNWLRGEFTNQNTITKHHVILGRYMNVAVKKRLIKYDKYQNFKLFKAKWVKGDKVPLTQDEVTRLDNLRHGDYFKNGEEHLLDAFLFSCYTGLRYGDVYELNTSHLKKVGEVVYIEKVMQKLRHLGRTVKLPVSILFDGEPLNIMHRQNINSPFYFIKYRAPNKKLKKLAQLADIDVNLTFHTARHTFLTRIAEKTGNVFTVMKLGGISQIGTAQTYINLVRSNEDLQLMNIKW